MSNGRSYQDCPSQNATCPVVVWRSELRSSPSRAPIVVGVDGSGTSAQVLLTAAEYATLFDAPLIAVQSCSSSHIGELTAPNLAYWNTHESVKRDRLDSGVDAAITRFPALSIRTLITMNSPERVLLERAELAQLVVIGPRDDTRPQAGPILGPVGRHLLLHNPCPTMICHDPIPGPR